MIQAWSYIGNQSVSRVVFANSGYASLTLPSAAPVPVGSQSDYEVFGNGQDGSYTAVFEKSTDGGVTWATYGQVLRTAYGQYTSFQVNPPTDYLQATDAGVLYRARLGALDELDVRASIYTTPIRVDYVVIGFTMPSLANQTAIGGEATFSLTFSPHVSGVPIGGFWERSTNGGSTWSTVAGGTRTISGSNTVMSLALTGLTSANNQTLYRFAAMAHGYGNNFQTPIFGRTNSATLTVT
jgi:hypothetical protein